MTKIEQNFERIREFRTRFDEGVTRLCMGGKITQKQQEEYSNIFVTLDALIDRVAVFLDFMHDVSPNDMEGVIIPDSIIKAVEKIYPSWNDYNFNADTKAALIYSAYQATATYQQSVADRLFEILDEFANLDEDFGIALLSFKSFMLEV